MIVSKNLPDGHTWRRVADPAWENPVDTSYAYRCGGRWNAPNTRHTLYLCEDHATAAAQIERLLEGSMFVPQDLTDEAFVTVPVRLPHAQQVADAVTDHGLVSLELPTTYPLDSRGRIVAHRPCQKAGNVVARKKLKGVHARSAVPGAQRAHRELAWFPDTSDAATITGSPEPYGQWRTAMP